MSNPPRLDIVRTSADVWTVTLNRPEVRNVYDAQMIHELTELTEQVRRELPRVVVLRGRGRHFQAGADLRWMTELRGQSEADNQAMSRVVVEMFTALNQLPCVLIAAVQGACLGGGTGIVASADVVIASDDAFFAIAEVRWGLQPSVIIPQLNDALGVRQVRRFALTGERFDAQTAARFGLVHEVVPISGLAERVDQVVVEVLANAPEAVRATKRHILDHSWSASLSDAAPEFADAQALAMAHANARLGPEAAEGFTAFAQKRPAAWVVTGNPGTSPSTEGDQ